MHRSYVTEDITIFWDSDKCRHAKMCVSGSPKVFEFGRRPWIKPENGSSREIWETVKKCPSGALDVIYNHDVTIGFDETAHCSVAVFEGKQIGECDYEDTGDAFNIYHTEVDSEHGGKGIAKRLVYRVIEEAERRGRSVIPTCSYAAKIYNS